MLHIYYGNGKGKTCAAVGAAVRAAGQNLSVCFIQHLKSAKTGEHLVLQHIPNITVAALPESLPFTDIMTIEQRRDARALFLSQLNTAKQAVLKYDVVVMDELFSVLDVGYITKKDVIQFLKTASKMCEIIATGHEVADEILAIGDYVTCMEKTSHPFDKGVSARRGIEF